MSLISGLRCLWIRPSPVSLVAPSLSNYSIFQTLSRVKLVQGVQPLRLKSDKTNKLANRCESRLDYKILRERPLGPHRILAPGVKFDGRIGENKEYRRIVHYPKDGKYTVKRLEITKLGGRDIVTGRKIIGQVGGGRKQKFRWVDFHRFPLDRDPSEDYVERVIKICYDPIRASKLALVAHEDHQRWIIATENMKEDDVIRSTAIIPETAVKPIEGDCYPVGALPEGTQICLVQMMPNEDKYYGKNAEQSFQILRKLKDRVIIKQNDKKPKNKLEYSIEETCQCTVGKVSIHPLKIKIGPIPQRKRWLGIHPRSGKWNRKTGMHGKKNKKLPPVIEVKPEKPPLHSTLLLTSLTEGIRGNLLGRKRPRVQLF